MSAYGAYGSASPTAQSQRLQSLLEGELALTKRLRLRGQARLEIEAEDELEPGRPNQDSRSEASRRWLIGDRGVAELEEFFVDARLERWDLRVGKQQTVWGTSDGLKVLDIVNPQSFREFILDDYERSRIPLWSMSAVRAFGDRSAFELIVIPDLSFHDVPEAGALFEITSPQLTPQGSPQSIDSLGLLADRISAVLLGSQPELAAALDPLGPLLQPLSGLAAPLLRPAVLDLLSPRLVDRTQRPSTSLNHTEYGLRLRGDLGEFEAALCVLRHFNDTPGVRVEVLADRVDVQRHYIQTTSWGAQLSRPVGAALLRFEGVYGTRAPIPALDFQDDGRSIVAPSYGLVAGIDLPVRDAGLLSFQIGESGLMLGPDNQDVPDRNPFATALWRDEILVNRLSGEVFSAVSLERGDVMLRARLMWMVDDRLMLRFGLDGFEGDDMGTFGQFDQRDRMSVELVWSV
ncbi:MAG: DUF1302 family protein [Panacagrimonas sp.]